jgi:hypothetical protein
MGFPEDPLLTDACSTEEEDSMVKVNGLAMFFREARCLGMLAMSAVPWKIEKLEA